MPDYSGIEQQFREALRLERRPVAVAFRASPPADVAKFSGSQPSGCSFWRLAAAGRAFYTVPGEHYNCTIGSYTHNAPFRSPRPRTRPDALMTDTGYLKMTEVPAIPRLPETPGVVVYAPLGRSPLEPDVVLFAGQPGKIMLLQEAAQRAGAEAGAPMLGRPTCMVLPAALAGHFVVSSGCFGNRVYTGVKDDELCAAFPGRYLERIAAQIEMIVGPTPRSLIFSARAARNWRPHRARQTGRGNPTGAQFRIEICE